MKKKQNPSAGTNIFMLIVGGYAAFLGLWWLTWRQPSNAGGKVIQRPVIDLWGTPLYLAKARLSDGDCSVFEDITSRFDSPVVSPPDQYKSPVIEWKKARDLYKSMVSVEYAAFKQKYPDRVPAGLDAKVNALLQKMATTTPAF